MPGLFKIKDPAAWPQVYAAADLSAPGCPTTPSQTSYLVYDIEPAAEFSAYIWDYAALENKPAMAAKGHPYAVPLMAVLSVGRSEGDGMAT